MRHVYLDNNATTALDPAVLEAMLPYYREQYGNAASIHSLGQRARQAVEDARARVAALINASASEIVFTSGGTEADNTALKGVASRLRAEGNHILTSTIEHSAVLRTCEQLEGEGFQVTYLPVDRQGMLRLDKLEAALTEASLLISIMHVNNEIGVIEPIQKISALARERGILLHTDAVQSVGKIPVDVNQLGVDLLSLSAHKFHGPKGVGALYVRSGTRMDALLQGGAHERRRRAGTLNVAGIVGLGEACRLAQQSMEDFSRRVGALRDRLERGILDRIPGTEVNGSTTNRVPHLTSISFRKVEGEALLIALDLEGVAVSTGSACSSGSVEPSHVLTALGCDAQQRDSAIRFSLSRMTTEADIEYVLERLPALIKRMRSVSPLYRT